MPPRLRPIRVPSLESLEGRRLMTRGLTAAPAAPGLHATPSTTDPAFPHIASTRLIHPGKSATGFAITFTRPMDAATVGNVGNYYVSDPSKVGRNMARAGDLGASLVPLKSARYDPTTSTVTLTAKGPLKPSSTFIVANENLFGPLKTGADYERFLSHITHFADTSGQPLDGLGVMAVVVSQAHPDGVPLV